MLLELTNKFRKAAEYKIDVEVSCVSLTLTTIYLKRKSRNNPIYNIKKNKTLRDKFNQ